MQPSRRGLCLRGAPGKGRRQVASVFSRPPLTHSGRSSEDKKKQSGDNTHPARIASYTHCAPLLALSPLQASSGLTPALDTLPGSGHPGSPLVPGPWAHRQPLEVSSGVELLAHPSSMVRAHLT